MVEAELQGVVAQKGVLYVMGPVTKTKKIEIAIASCMTLPEPDPDQRPLTAALEVAGISSRVMPWDDPGQPWPEAEVTLIRSTWNYAWNLEAYLAWAESASRTSRLLNPLEVVRWNCHKGYLLVRLFRWRKKHGPGPPGVARGGGQAGRFSGIVPHTALR